MGKNLLEYITSKNSKKEPSQGAKNRTAFLAQFDDIKDALAAGCSKKDVWEALKEQGKINFGYIAFLRYVKGIMESGAVSKKPDEQPVRKEDSISSDAASSSPRIAKLTKEDMRYNPNVDPKELF